MILLNVGYEAGRGLAKVISPVMRRIFVSYRRADVGEELASRVANHLRERLSDTEVFVDRSSIGIGTYPSQLDAALASSHIVLAVIGKDWRGASGTGVRLDDPEDWVRRELQTALRADKLVVPVLVDVELPAVDQLPVSLRPLCQYQAYRIDKARFSEGADLLADAILEAELAPTLRRRDAEETAFRELKELVARLTQRVLDDRLDIPQLVRDASSFMDLADNIDRDALDDDRRRVLVAAQSVLEVLAKSPRNVFQYAAFRPHAAVVGGMAEMMVNSALQVGSAERYAFENAHRALVTAAELIARGVTSYTSQYAGDVGSVTLPVGTRFLVAAHTVSRSGIAVFATIDGRSFARIGIYTARSQSLRRVQLRSARNQEPKLYAFDDRSIYRWRLESTVPEVEWPIPDDDLEHTFEQLHVLQGERIEFLAGEGVQGRRWLKYVGRPDLVEVPTRTPGIGGTFRDDSATPFGVATTGKDRMVLEELGEQGRVESRDVSIADALAMRPELFAFDGPPRKVYPPAFVDVARYRGFRCALADCAIAYGGDALLFLDAERGTWLRTPIVHRAFRGSAQLVEAGERSYLVRATADRQAAAVVWDVSNPLDLDAPPVVARWASEDWGAYAVSARAPSQTLVICSSMAQDAEQGHFAVLSHDEHPPYFVPVTLEGAAPELTSAIAVDAPAARERIPPLVSQLDGQYKYKAFISYSHAADDALAPQLQSMLQQFAKPWYRLRAFRVFRDKTGLGLTASLWPAIEQALKEAEFFVLLASPEAARSQWVTREVAWWLRHRATSRILIVWTSGELVWRPDAKDFDWNVTTALPDLLRAVFEYEPLYLDLRWAKRKTDASPRRGELRDAVARLASTLRNQPLDELIGEDVREHRKFRIFSTGAVAAVLVFAGVATWQAAVARREARVAESQTEIAKREAAISESRALAAQSGEALSRDLGAALRLAVDAHHEHATEEANAALARALGEPRLRRILEHPRPVVQLDITGSKPRILLSRTDDGVVRLWNVDNGQQLAKLGSGLTYAAFSPDGSTIATADEHRTVQLWDRVSLRPEATLVAGDAEVSDDEDHRIAALVWSRDGKWLAGPDYYGFWNLWNAVERKRVDYFEVFGEFSANAAFSPDSSRALAFSSASDDAAVIDLSTGKKTAVGVHDPGKDMWNGNGASTDGLSAATFSPDGTQVMFGTDQGRLEVWNVAQKKKPASIALSLRGFASSVTDVAFMKEGFAAAGSDGTVRTWTVSGEPKAIMVGHTARIKRLVLSPEGHVLLTISIDGTARTWNLDTGFPIAVLVGHGMAVTDAVFLDDLHVLTSGADGTVRAWDLGNALGSVQLGDMPDNDVEFSRDGSRIAVVRRNHRMLQVYGRAGDLIAIVKRPAVEWEDAIVSPDATRAAILTKSGSVEVVDVANDKTLFEPRSEQGMVHAVAFSPDGGTLVLVADGGALTAIDVASGKPVGDVAIADTALAARGRVFTAVTRQVEEKFGGRVQAFGPRRSLALVERDDGVVLVRIDDGHPDVKLDVPRRITWVTAFSSDGTRIAIADPGGRVRIFDTLDGRRIATLAGNPSDVRMVEFSRDGARVLMLCDNGEIRLADPATGRVVTTLTGIGKPTIAHLSPDGKQLLTGGDDELARVFTLDPDELARRAQALLPVTIRASDAADVHER